MTVEQFRRVHAARPFQPFEIHLADSRRLRVDHPEMLLQSKTGRTFAVAHPDDSIEIVDLLLVAGLKPLKNGPSGRPRGRS